MLISPIDGIDNCACAMLACGGWYEVGLGPLTFIMCAADSTADICCDWLGAWLLRWCCCCGALTPVDDVCVAGEKCVSDISWLTATTFFPLEL